MSDSPIARRFRPFGTTIFTEMTALAQKHNAVNLSQGFPDFDGPDFIKDAAAKAMADGHNQYARMAGIIPLVETLAERWHRLTGQTVDPLTQVTVTAGCTEALAAAALGLLNPGDEAILFEPFYDSYRPCLAMAGAVPKFVTLTPQPDGGFGFDPAALEEAVTPGRTRAIFLNTPHNPTGKVFTRAELESIAELCRRHDLIAVTDEVYEHLVFEGEHIRLAMLPGMAERTLTLSSLGKTFSLTGWKIGWAIGPADLTAALRSAHQFLTFAVATPLQHAAVAALRAPEGYFTDFLANYRARRDYLLDVLRRAGLRPVEPQGTYFILADHRPLGFADDVAFCRHLVERVGVAAIPPSAFYEHREHGAPFARFAFCKSMAVLEEAGRRLARLSS